MAKTLKQFFQELTSKGGKARAAKLTAAQRRKIAQKGAKARWAKAKKEGSNGSR